MVVLIDGEEGEVLPIQAWNGWLEHTIRPSVCGREHTLWSLGGYVTMSMLLLEGFLLLLLLDRYHELADYAGDLGGSRIRQCL